MRFLFLCCLFLLLSLALADCGCGAKCAKYSDASRCTRCCTGTVKRSLRHETDPTQFLRGYRFLVNSDLYRMPAWSHDVIEIPESEPSDMLLQDLDAILEALESP